MKCNQSRPEFELVSPCPFLTTITITPRPPPQLILFVTNCSPLLVRNFWSYFAIVRVKLLALLTYRLRLLALIDRHIWQLLRRIIGDELFATFMIFGDELSMNLLSIFSNHWWKIVGQSRRRCTGQSLKIVGNKLFMVIVEAIFWNC